VTTADVGVNCLSLSLIGDDEGSPFGERSLAAVVDGAVVRSLVDPPYLVWVSLGHCLTASGLSTMRVKAEEYS
jgi:hypothetical protein